jgi:tartrate dehydrogenase/decarboxylase/D-malate dehydrogenase
MMLAWLGESSAAEAIQAAVRHVLGPGGLRTRDIGGQASTVELGEAVARALDAR